jgi:sialate O-acetylesterase
MCQIRVAGIFVFFLFFSFAIKAEEQRLINLKGQWKFSLGFKNEWLKLDFDDSNWESLYVPGNWENQGFYGYDGFACYRKKIEIPETYSCKSLSLHLGMIDDCDEVYLNGHLVGFSGAFPPNYYTAYNVERKYDILPEYILPGKTNILVVKVYDDGQEGGIVKGDIGIYESLQKPPFDIILTGIWNFRLGDNPEYKKTDYNDSKWAKITVPRNWESQGYPDYDGFAWYRRTCYVPASLTKEKVVVVMGKIDDLDEVYINGTYIGTQKGLIDNNRYDVSQYNKLRVYYIDGSLFTPDKQNVIAVRVYDSGGYGGIYEGPVGIMSQKAFVQFWRTNKQGGSW